jgi:preprotein translocase subunit YajC
MTGIFVGVFFLLIFIFLFWQSHKKERDQVRKRIDDIIEEIVEDEAMFSVIRLMTKSEKVSIEDIEKTVGNDSKARMVIERLKDMAVALGFFAVPVVRQVGIKLKLTPRWLNVFKEFEKHDWNLEEKFEFVF